MSRDPFGMTVVWDTPRRADWEAAEKIVRMLLSGKSADEQALDPAVAALRCWEHEDCREHPELALACADGRSTPVGIAGGGGCDNLTTHETIYGDGDGDTRGDGDGHGNMWGGWNGVGGGVGYGLPVIDADVRENDGDGGSPGDPWGRGGWAGSDDAWIALDFVESYYTTFPTEAERFIEEGRLNRSGW